MKITADTNVLVSATFWHGASDKVMSKAEAKEIQLILSQEIIEEYGKVLQYKEIQDKIKDKKLEMKLTLKKIASIAIIIAPNEKVIMVKDDPDDNKILECAKAGNVNYIISKDTHLLRLGQFENIPILTPEEFIKILEVS